MRAGRRVTAVGAATVGVVMSGCVRTAPTAQGQDTADLYQLFAAIAAVIFVIVAALIGWSIVRYRKAPDDDVLPNQFHTNVKLEILWFAIPQAIVIGLFIASAVVLNHERDLGEEADVTVEVEAFQWGWRFTYEGPDIVLESLPSGPARVILPVGRDILFRLESKDVIHSFYVPEFLVKRDVVPGRINELVVKIDTPGVFTARCAEFCGLLHDRMDFIVNAVNLDDYQAWVQEWPGNPPEFYEDDV